LGQPVKTECPGHARGRRRFNPLETAIKRFAADRIHVFLTIKAFFRFPLYFNMLSRCSRVNTPQAAGHLAGKTP